MIVSGLIAAEPLLRSPEPVERARNLAEALTSIL